MKRAITLLSLIAGLSSAATAETLWVYGVNEYGGWYDADKTDADADLNKCWAAVSSNLINWWQNQYDIPATFNYGVEYKISDEDEVWECYLVNTRTVMSNVESGVDWWWNGGNTSNSFDNNPFTGTSDSWVYYTYMCMDNYGYYHRRSDYLQTIEPEVVGVDGMVNALYTALSGDAARWGIGLNVGSGMQAPLHGITMWGAEFDEEKKLTALWVTDSDDAVLNASGGDLDLFKVNVEYTDNGLKLMDYWYQEASIIESITVLDAAKTDSWKLERVYLSAPSAPEPTSATLSLLALAGLAARRRRK